MPTIKQCRQRLAIIWLICSGILFVILIVQTIFKHYGEKAAEAWSWFLPMIMPTLGLIIAVLVRDFRDATTEVPAASRFMYVLCALLSISYLFVLGLTFLLSPFSPWTPLELMKQASLYLGPFQGIVAGALGAFFVSKS